MTDKYAAAYNRLMARFDAAIFDLQAAKEYRPFLIFTGEHRLPNAPIPRKESS